MMDLDVTITKRLRNDSESPTQTMLRSGTGFMISLSETIRELQRRGYTENLGPANDHLCSRSGEIKLYPHDIKIDSMVRFENSSDPDDQAILYAVRCDSRALKGLYVDSYGAYHDDLTPELLKCFKDCPY